MKKATKALRAPAVPRFEMVSAVGSFAESESSYQRLRSIPALPRPGDTIAGKYALVRLIGEGGMGVVYEATHIRLQQRLAIKVLRPDVPDFGGVVTRFEREARSAAQLKSIHTARIIDVDALPSGLPYIVLEFLEGVDLDAELGATGALPVEEAVDIVLQVADAMSEAHSLGIIHRDLKPSNLFVCRVGERQRRIIKVLDFGISKSEGEDRRLTPTHAYFGTPYYAAPEQLRAANAADARSDVWSLGAILFELLTGRTPFVGTPTSVITHVVADPVPWPTEFRADLPRDLARLIMRALKRDPDERFQSMRELAQALEVFGPEQSLADAVAEAPRGRGKLGEILISDGLLTAADLERALAEQRRTGKLLGRVLLDMSMVSQADLLTALAKQQGVIVSPERPNRIERELQMREAVTVTPPSSARPPFGVVGARGRGAHGWLGGLRRHAWMAAALVGMPVGVAVALWIGAAMKSRAQPAGLVAEPAGHSSVPGVALIPTASLPTSAPARVGAPGPSLGALPAGRAGVSAPRAAPAVHAAPRSPPKFEPSGI